MYKLIKYPLPEKEYYPMSYKKTQIVLHDTASSGNVKGVIDWWAKDPRKVATPYIIAPNGDVWECFNPKYWAAAIGYYITGDKGNIKAHKLLPQTANRECNREIEHRSINIELTNWEWLKLKGNKYYNYVNGVVLSEQVVKLETPFRGFQYYHKYTPAQIQSLEQLIKEIGAKFNIPLVFSQSFEFDKNAVLGVPGIYTHSNFRFDKVDLHPEPAIIETLKKFSPSI